MYARPQRSYLPAHLKTVPTSVSFPLWMAQALRTLAFDLSVEEGARVTVSSYVVELVAADLEGRGIVAPKSQDELDREPIGADHPDAQPRYRGDPYERPSLGEVEIPEAIRLPRTAEEFEALYAKCGVRPLGTGRTNPRTGIYEIVSQETADADTRARILAESNAQNQLNRILADTDRWLSEQESGDHQSESESDSESDSDCPPSSSSDDDDL